MHSPFEMTCTAARAQRWLCSLGASATLFLGVAPALGQDGDTERNNVVLADLGLHVINVGYQRNLSGVIGVQVSAGYYRPWTVNENVLGLGGGDHDPSGDVAGFVLRTRAFIHPMADAPAGLWLSPYIQAGVVSATRNDEDVSGATYAGGLSVGYTFWLGERVLLALGAGGQYHVARVEGSTDFPGFARFGPTLDLNVGYAF